MKVGQCQVCRPLDVSPRGDERRGEGGSPSAGVRELCLSWPGSWPEHLCRTAQGTVGFL